MKSLITQNPNILGGKPIIAGTRMSVESILELLASDMKIDEILKEYPFLQRQHVLAAIEYANKLVGRTESVIFDTAKKVQSRISTHEISGRR